MVGETKLGSLAAHWMTFEHTVSTPAYLVIPSITRATCGLVAINYRKHCKQVPDTRQVSLATGELPVICLTRYIPLPSSVLFEILVPMTLFGLGRPEAPAPLQKLPPICFVGLMLLVGLNPPPVSCFSSPDSFPNSLSPVNCLAIVVPECCTAMPLDDVPVEDGTRVDPNKS